MESVQTQNIQFKTRLSKLLSPLKLFVSLSSVSGTLFLSPFCLYPYLIKLYCTPIFPLALDSHCVRKPYYTKAT